jgi:hypothetical protein
MLTPQLSTNSKLYKKKLHMKISNSFKTVIALCALGLSTASFAQTALTGQAPAAGTNANTLITIAGKKVNIETASATQEGLVKFADAAAITAGTTGLVVDAAQLKAATAATSTLTSANIFVGNGSNVATGVALSGDATIANTGALTLVNTSVTGQALTGYAIAGSVAALDATKSIMVNMGQLEKNITAAAKTSMKDTFTATVGQTVFVPTATPLATENVNMYINGVLAQSGSMNATATAYDNTKNYGYALEAGDKVEITYFK